MKYTMTAENKNDGYRQTLMTDTSMMEARERINFMLECIATPDELIYVQENMESIFEELGYSFTWESQG